MNRCASILIVDDEPAVREAMAHLLQFCGHEVEAVGGGVAALARLEERSFDLVITDFCMPGMSGDQLIARIRDQLPLQPIILSSGFAEEYRLFGKEAGRVDAVLRKPFSYHELKDLVAQVLTSAEEEGSIVLPPPEEPSRERPLPPPPIL